MNLCDSAVLQKATVFLLFSLQVWMSTEQDLGFPRPKQEAGVKPTEDSSFKACSRVLEDPPHLP